MLKELINFLRRNLFITLNKSFIGPHLEYADIIYDNSNNICHSVLPPPKIRGGFWFLKFGQRGGYEKIAQK